MRGVIVETAHKLSCNCKNNLHESSIEIKDTNDFLQKTYTMNSYTGTE